MQYGLACSASLFFSLTTVNAPLSKSASYAATVRAASAVTTDLCGNQPVS